VDILTPVEMAEGSAPVEDSQSRKGRFGWFQIGHTHLPFVLRGEDGMKYCSARVAEKLLLQPLLTLPQSVLDCAQVEAQMMTEAEAKLHNEINTKHMDMAFGKEMFTTKDKLVTISSVEQFFSFLNYCQQKLTTKESKGDSERWGFVRIQIDEERSDLPYIVMDEMKHVPVFYFEGETENLFSSSVPVKSWDLPYLKFLCCVQGVKEELVESPQATLVIKLNSLLQLLPSFSISGVEEFWPQENFIPSNSNCVPKPVGCSWARLPSTIRSVPPWLRNLTLIKDFPSDPLTTGGPGGDYRLLRAILPNNLELEAINVRPGVWTDLVVTLPDLVKGLVPGLGLHQTGQMLTGQGIILYRANSGQAAVLAKQGKEAELSPVPLVLARDLVKSMGSLLAAAQITGRRGVGN